MGNTELTLDELVAGLETAGISFKSEAITYGNDVITFGDNIIDVDTFKAIKDDPKADKGLPYKITILVPGSSEGEDVKEYKLALYLSSDQTKVESAIEG